jgi:hypothetical protein
MNQTDKVLYTAAVHTTGGREARGCVGTAARRHWQSQEPLPLGVWSRMPSARRPGRAGSHFGVSGVREATEFLGLTQKQLHRLGEMV